MAQLTRFALLAPGRRSLRTVRASALMLSAVILSTLMPAFTSAHAYDSIIKPAVRTVYWGVTSDECTAVHALNISTGALAWRRSPVEEEQTWSMQVTDKRVFYTLQSSPSVTAVSIDTGNARWTWPDRVGRIWKRWDTDLPQTAQLATPLPAISAQLLLIREQQGSSKVLALSSVTGNLTWEYDAVENVTQAAAAAGLGGPQQVTVDGWMLEGPDTLFLAVNALHPAAPTAATPPPPNARSHPTTSQWPQATLTQQAGQHEGEAQDHIRGPRTRAFGARRSGWRGKAGGVGEDGDDGDVEARGWVVALDLSTGATLWVSGPLERTVERLVVSEPALLVTAAADADGTGWLYGLDKGSGALLYALHCPNGPCNVQVADTRVGLLTASLQRPTPVLADLSAFDMSNGDWLWRGLPSSTLAGRVIGDCTAVVAPRMHVYFACTCMAPAGPVATGTQDPGEEAEVKVTVAQTQGGEAEAERAKEDLIGRARRRPPPPRPAPPPAPGLCAFALATETGKLGFEVVLSSGDGIPSGAATYGFTPFVTADVVVFRGRQGVYAMPQLSNVPDIDPDSQGSASPLRVQFSFQLPAGLQLQPWDWMDLKAGRLLLQASPPVPPPTDEATGPARHRCSKRKLHLQAPAQTRTDSSQPQMQQEAGQQEDQRQQRHRGSDRVVDGGISDEPTGLGSSWIFALDAQNGTLRWSLATNLSLGPLTAHTLPHDWGRGGLLLVDGCRPPLDELQAGTGAAAAPRRWWTGWGGIAWPAPGDQQNSGVPRHTGPVRSLGSQAAPGFTPGHMSTPGVVTLGLRGDSNDTDDNAHKGPQPEALGDGMSCCLYAVSVEDGRVVWRHCYDMGKACSSGLARHTATNIVYILLGTQVVVLLLGCTVGTIMARRSHANAAAAMTIMQDPDSENEALLVAIPGTTGINHRDWDDRDED